MPAKKPRFFCEFCGSEVKQKDKFCPRCGKFFASVRCPACGFAGDSSVFRDGCPACGYAVNGRGSNRSGPEGKRGNATPDPLPWWIYPAVSLIFIALLAIALIH
ncbi:zinc ribbon domain-containing protein [Treponema zuelzerae]|uniref:Zinc ribbon domain-containing protein n=1 Tax=Teretinema zuelzerae TaxID=156 RepID=A0AAE3EG91_9SPIR|nr:zinc ribbon domain-containing protein [Teretinema zuelzerae]MCD1653196.1 zinc ribbon domain-containing protein [Teretinema zuelzerae]